ncbi:hypothetical protein [Pseudomonas viridiflava]|uniref:hypothetical protein n=1 Tax=Pseudomonas viridiflava TaxID=33069 RepID=UPI0013C3748C|nr:hypothetical protein [Pseudomonas viridiflava]
MTNGYLVEQVWRLRCNGKIQDGEYRTKEEAEEAAKNKVRCNPLEKPKPKNTPTTNPDKKPPKPKM